MTTAATSTRPAPCDGRRGLRAAAARRRAGVGQRPFRPRCRRAWRRRRDGTLRDTRPDGSPDLPRHACLGAGVDPTGGDRDRADMLGERILGRDLNAPPPLCDEVLVPLDALRMPAWIKAISGVFGSRTGLRWREAGSERERSASGWPRPSPTGSCGSLRRSWAMSSSSSPPVRATWGSRLQLCWVRADG